MDARDQNIYIQINHKNDIKKIILQELEKDDLSESILQNPFIAVFAGERYRDNIIGFLLTNMGSDIQSVALVKALLQKGIPLPRLTFKKQDFKTTAEYWLHLIHCARDLFISLHEDPDIVNKPDEKGQTLLHHAGHSLYLLGTHGASIILNLLLDSPKLDFSIQDQDGNTPLHLAAIRCSKNMAAKLIYFALKRAATKVNKIGETESELFIHASMISEITQTLPFFARKLPEQKQTIASLIADFAKKD